MRSLRADIWGDCVSSARCRRGDVGDAKCAKENEKAAMMQRGGGGKGGLKGGKRWDSEGGRVV